MMKMKGLAIISILLGVLLLSSCVSMMVSMAKSDYKDFGVLDSSVPDDQQCEIRFGGIRITSFNGEAVKWGSANVANARAVTDNKYSSGHIKVPAGENTIVFDFIQVNTEQTNTSIKPQYTEYTYTTTTTSAKDITLPNISMLAGHNYFIGAEKRSDGKLDIWLFDMTNWPYGFYGDDVINAPKKSKTPTEFEGKWIGGKRGNIVVYTFKGNTWESSISPYTWTNIMSPGVVRCRGTFTAENGVLTLYVTHRWGLVWINFKSAKEAHIFNYSIEGNNMELEWPRLAPNMRFIRDNA